MSDTKLFRIADAVAVELPSQSMQVEKSLQQLFEANLQTLLGIRFLRSEYSTGPVHGGRIDTLGLDENGSPVIIEYKRATNENVINQGLFYLDWLLDHRHEFQWIAMETLGKSVAETIDWSSPRLLCIAGDFTRYDGHAVKQIARNIELIRYRRFGDDLLTVELVHAPQSAGRAAQARAAPLAASPDDPAVVSAEAETRRSEMIAYRLGNASADLRDVWDAASAYLQALGDDVQLKELKLYHAFKRIKNFACLELYPTARTVHAYLKLDPSSILIEPGFTRDMRGVGHFGTGDLQVIMTTLDDVAKAQPLFQRAYEAS